MRKLRGKDIVGDTGTDEKIRRIINRVRNELKPEKIILFGSYARGDYHDKSDVDLLIIGNFKERFFDRIGKVLGCNDTDLEVEALAYTPKEFERNKNAPFFEKIRSEGIIV